MRHLPLLFWLLLIPAAAGIAFADTDIATDIFDADTVAIADTAILADRYADTLTIDTATAAIMDTSAMTGSGPAVTDVVFYEADFAEYDHMEQVLTLYGKAEIRYQNITLQADTIIYIVQQDQFQARGLPQLIDGGDTTVGDFMAYNIKTRRGRVTYATTRFDETYVTGSNIVLTPDNCLYIEQGDYTTCQNPEHPHYFFYGRHIKVIPEDKVISRPVILNIADAPIIALPYFIMPLQRDRRSGWLSPSWGGSVSRGGYIDNIGYYVAPSDYYDAALSTKVQEFNSFVFNARMRYALRYVLDGEVSGRYVIDNRLETVSHQWAFDYRHNQFLTPDGRTRLSGRGNILSNRTFNQLYSDDTHELEQQQLDANMSLSHRFHKINASTNLTWRRNHNLITDRIIEDMPSFDFNLQSRPFIPHKPGLGDSYWYNNIFYSYNTKSNVRRDAYGNDSLPGFIRPGSEHNININSSQKVFNYFNVSPYFNVRTSMFLGAIDTLVKDTVFYRDTVVYKVRDPNRDTNWPHYIYIGDPTPEIHVNEFGEFDTVYTITKVSPLRQHLVRDTMPNDFNLVSSWNTGVNLSTRIYGLFPMGGLMGMTAIRHTMTPTVGYAYIPEHQLDKMFYNVGINYERPRDRAQQLMNFSVANNFQGKRMVGARTGSSVDHPNGMRGKMIGERNDTLGTAGVYDTGAVDSVGRAGHTAGSPSDNRGGSALREEKFDILSLSLSTAYNFEADERKWRDLNLNANTSVRILNIGFSSAFWLYDDIDELVLPIMRNYNIDLTSRGLGVAGKLWDGSLSDVELSPAVSHDVEYNRVYNLQDWSLSFAPSFSHRASRRTPHNRFEPSRSFNINTTANAALTNALTVRWNGNYDFTGNRFTHNNFTFHYDLECWEMRFTWRPEKINPGFHFVVNIKKIQDVKWEQRESRTTTRVL